jgi:hypothetical protein
MFPSYCCIIAALQCKEGGVMRTVMERLMGFSPTGKMLEWEYPLVQSSIDDLQKKGWTDDEIVAKLRWLEHVNPNTNEDVALRRMLGMDQEVARRMASTK